MREIFDLVRNGDLKHLINNKNHYNLNIRDSSNKTPLHYAVNYNAPEIVSFLLINGADINAIDSLGETPLFSACRKAKFLVVKLLVDNGAQLKIINKKGETAFHLACTNNDLGIIKYLVSKCYELIEKTAPSKKHGIHYAVLAGNVDVVKYFIEELKVKTTILDFKKNSLLHYAAYQTNTTLIKYFLELNLDVNQLNDQFETPLFYVAKIRQKNCFKVFLDNYAYVEIKNIRHESVFDILEQTNSELVEFLYEYVNSPRYKNYVKKNELQVLVLNRDFKAIKEFCLDVKITGYDFHNHSALYYARKYNFNSSSELIRKVYPNII